jgi:hypothetical protein
MEYLAWSQWLGLGLGLGFTRQGISWRLRDQQAPHQESESKLWHRLHEAVSVGLFYHHPNTMLK